MNVIINIPTKANQETQRVIKALMKVPNVSIKSPNRARQQTTLHGGVSPICLFRHIQLQNKRKSQSLQNQCIEKKTHNGGNSSNGGGRHLAGKQLGVWIRGDDERDIHHTPSPYICPTTLNPETLMTKEAQTTHSSPADGTVNAQSMHSPQLMAQSMRSQCTVHS